MGSYLHVTRKGVSADGTLIPVPIEALHTLGEYRTSCSTRVGRYHSMRCQYRTWHSERVG
eukprot:626719-Rhodomonas_salina.1